MPETSHRKHLLAERRCVNLNLGICPGKCRVGTTRVPGLLHSYPGGDNPKFSLSHFRPSPPPSGIHRPIQLRGAPLVTADIR